MIVVNANTLSSLPIGRCGENLARKVVFDIRDLESLYGPGVAELIYQRPGDAAPYPVAAVREGDTLLWTPTATDTAKESTIAVGSGQCELRWYVGDILAKSKIWRTWVEPAMGTPSETAPPEPEQGWVDQVVAVGAAAKASADATKASADAAKADADRAAALAAEVAEKAAKTAQDATESAQAKEAAQTAQRLAEEAQSAAEAARNAAETAQAAAERSATNAATAKQGAEAALKAAQDAAAAAAKALADLQALYQEMQTWAQGVVQDVNEAASHAVQSVQSAGDAQVQRVTNEGETQTANAKAQANAAAQSAAGAAQSAQQAAESAAVYDTVVADVTQLKQDISDKLPKSPANWGPWTAEEQAVACERIGAEYLGEWEEIVTITTEEAVSSLTVNTDKNGNPFSLTHVICEFILPIEDTAKQRNVYFGSDSVINAQTSFSRVQVSSDTTVKAEAVSYAKIISGKIYCDGAIGQLIPNKYQPAQKHGIINGYCMLSAESFDRIFAITYNDAFPAGSQLIIRGIRK